MAKFIISVVATDFTSVMNIAAKYSIEYTIANGQIFLFINDAQLLVIIAQELKNLETG